MEMTSIAYLQGYLSALAVINDIYDRYISYEFKIEEIDRGQTPLETIISVHQEWEGKYLSHYEYELAHLPYGYTDLENRLNVLLLLYEVNLLQAAQPKIDMGEKLNEQLLSLRQNIANERLSPCKFFVRALEEYVAEEVSIYEYYLKNWTRKKETPSNYSFTIMGTQVLLWGSKKALRLVIELSD